jgi:hypothetical protein
MPKVCTEARRDEKAIINPYIAFRRRLDKVQTRKKQKTELMTYEKMLHINFSMKRSIVLISALAQRERLKKVDCDLALLMFQLQYKKRMSNQALEELIKQQVASTSAEHKPAEIIPTTSGSQLIKDFELPEDFRHKNSWNSTNNDNLTEDKCLQRNLEVNKTLNISFKIFLISYGIPLLLSRPYMHRPQLAIILPRWKRLQLLGKIPKSMADINSGENMAAITGHQFQSAVYSATHNKYCLLILFPISIIVPQYHLHGIFLIGFFYLKPSKF